MGRGHIRQGQEGGGGFQIRRFPLDIPLFPAVIRSVVGILGQILLIGIRHRLRRQRQAVDRQGFIERHQGQTVIAGR